MPRGPSFSSGKAGHIAHRARDVSKHAASSISGVLRHTDRSDLLVIAVVDHTSHVFVFPLNLEAKCNRIDRRIKICLKSLEQPATTRPVTNKVWCHRG